MAGVSSGECPRCGRPLKQFNGKIGYCSMHQWVSPLGLGFDAEASEKNEQEKARLESKRLQEEALKQQEKQKEQDEIRSRNIRKLLVLLGALAIIIIAVVVLIVRPSVEYNRAVELLNNQKYSEAKAAFSSLSNYKDSSAQALLCDFYIDLGTGNQ